MGRGVYYGGGYRPSFGDWIVSLWGTYPLQINMGTVGIGAQQQAADINASLALYPEAKYWCIGLGTNDAPTIMSGSNLADWRTDMTTICNAVLNAGKIPIVARIPYSSDANHVTTVPYLNTN